MKQETKSTPNTILIILEWLFLLISLAAITFASTFGIPAAIAIVLMVAGFLTRIVRTRRVIPRTGLEIPWLVFLISAGTAAWISYLPELAALQFTRFLAAAFLYYAVVESPLGMRDWIATGFLVAAAGLAVYFPLQYDYGSAPMKIGFINQIGMAINQITAGMVTGDGSSINSLLLTLTGGGIHPNVAAGTLAAAVPFGIALTYNAWKGPEPGNSRDSLPRSSSPFRLMAGILAAALTLLVLSGIVLTTSRGAAAALAGTGLLAALVFIQRRWFKPGRRMRMFWSIIGLLLLITGIILVLSGNVERLLGGVPDPSGSIQSRTRLWAQGLDMVGDYGFTGSGLMTFWMVHSAYNLQVYVPYIAHVHNTFLEIWIEQGIVGFLAFLAFILTTAIWTWNALKRYDVPILAWAGLGAWVVILLHGIVDVVFSVTRMFPVIGLVLAYAWMLNVRTVPEPDTTAKVKDSSSNLVVYVTGTIIALLVGVILLNARSLVSSFYANLGAVAQTRLELSQYDPAEFENLSIHDIRQSASPERLDPIMDYFYQSININPNNRTALQRLAQITHSRNEYGVSYKHAQRLWDAGYRDDTSRLLFGDALLANGEIQTAADTIKGLTWAEDRLMGAAWYRYWVKGDVQRAADAWRLVLLLNPDNPDAGYWLKEAEAKNDTKEETAP